MLVNVGNALASICAAKGMQAANSNFVALVSFSVMIYSVIADVFFFKETFSLLQIGGFVILLCSTIMEPIIRFYNLKA